MKQVTWSKECDSFGQQDQGGLRVVRRQDVKVDDSTGMNTKVLGIVCLLNPYLQNDIPVLRGSLVDTAVFSPNT